MNRKIFHLNNINTDDCPCKDCKPPKRSSTCHSTCEPYLSWNKDHLKKLEQRKQERDVNEACYSGAARRGKQLAQKGVTFGRNKK